MADFWQWKGDASTGAGLVHFTGTETVAVSGTVTTSISGTVTVAVSGNTTIASMLKGSPVTVVSATLTATLTSDTTYTSSETSVVGFNSVLLETIITGSAGVTAKTVIAGAMSSGGTMVAVIDKDTSAQMTTGFLASSQILRFTGLPDYLGFTLTLSAGITAGCSAAVKMMPFNM